MAKLKIKNTNTAIKQNIHAVLLGDHFLFSPDRGDVHCIRSVADIILLIEIIINRLRVCLVEYIIIYSMFALYACILKKEEQGTSPNIMCLQHKIITLFHMC